MEYVCRNVHDLLGEIVARINWNMKTDMESLTPNGTHSWRDSYCLHRRPTLLINLIGTYDEGSSPRAFFNILVDHGTRVFVH